MPCDCLDPDDFVCTGSGADLLVNTSLTWLLTTDGLTGTPPSEPEIPNGNINQLFWKLLQNDCAIANFIQSSFVRTYGADPGAAPAEDTVPVPLTGAPTTGLANGQLHTVVYTDFEVLYRYDATEVEWVEVNRREHLVQVVQTYEATVTVVLEEGDDEAIITIPTETDDEDAFAFAAKDLSLLYVNNPVGADPIIGAVHGFIISAGTIRVPLTAAVPVDPDHSLVAIFRRTVVS